MVFRALERGVRIDVGHGSHFSFDTAKAVIGAGIHPFTLGANMHGYNVGKGPNNHGTWQSDELNQSSVSLDFSYKPTFSLYTAMTELFALGVSVEEIVKIVTSNAAATLGMANELGSLAVGRNADISVLELRRGNFTLTDGGGTRVKATQRFCPVMAVQSGRVVTRDSPLLPTNEQLRRVSSKSRARGARSEAIAAE